MSSRLVYRYWKKDGKLVNNTEIYRATLGFSLRRFLWDWLSMLLAAALIVGDMLIADYATKGALAPIVGAVIGLILASLVLMIILRYVSYTYTAGQIAMMTKGITEGKLPDDVIGEGKQMVTERFGTVAAYFAVTKLINGLFRELGRGIESLGRSVGGDTGEGIGSAINSVIQTMVSYLCDCCLGWVFYRSDKTASKAVLEGGCIYFKHGKTLARNAGRIFGIGIVSFLLIAGVFGAVFYSVIMAVKPEFIGKIAATFARQAQGPDANWLTKLLADPATVPGVLSVAFGAILWEIIHGVFIKPYVLVGVLRNFLASGMKEIPGDAETRQLEGKSAKFRELAEKVI